MMSCHRASAPCAQDPPPPPTIGDAAAPQIRTAEMAGSLAEADQVVSAMHRRSNFALLKFLPAAVLSVTSHIAAPEK